MPIITLRYRIPLRISATVLYARKTGAVRERIITNRGHTIWNNYARKTGAVIERIITNGGHTIRNNHARKAGADLERTITN